MEDRQAEQILFETARERRRTAAGETAAFNILAALSLERCETGAHSKIIFFLLGEPVFLRFFLQAIGVPRQYLDADWKVFRERASDSCGRMDFVVESPSYCAVIEMKIDAADGEGQLLRYASFGRARSKSFGLFYLTPDGRMPEKQSAPETEREGIVCVSFERDVVSWLKRCMEETKPGDYRHSFLKQYLGAVRHMCKTDCGEADVKDLIVSSEMAAAAQTVAESFYEKMDEVCEAFFDRLAAYIGRKSGLFVYGGYAESAYIFVDRSKKVDCVFTLGIEYDPYLYVCFGFSESGKEGGLSYIPLEEAARAYPAFYKKWIGRLMRLPGLPKLRQSRLSRWFYVEDSWGARMNFGDYSAQIALVDQMDQQCEFLCNYICGQILLPLMQTGM